ncbi:heterokaryon incompatibility protein-domain-containing protein [Xylaria grammica]|nr:heterokaryon incompatibility protein-domain-containing protein [Xylaria grammica]
MNIQFIRRCINQCINDHQMCKTKLLSSAPFVPKRLLDVEYEEKTVRLIEGSQVDSGGSQLKYATLSYCWGTALTMKTTEENIDKHRKDGIAITKMPQTFQDAILVARSLDIRYLWIDALCIIQGHEQDWEEESVKMCDTFAYSYITIGAAISSSSSESFLERNPTNELNLHFCSSIQPNISGDYSIQLDGKDGISKDVDLSDTRWNTRAWVWQEQIMSTRQLIFAGKGLQFRCDNGIRLERGAITDDPTMTLGMGSSNIDYWEVFLKEFTHRNITNPKDRLAAVAGAAKHIHTTLQRTEDPMEYLAGLWLDTKLERFCSHLLWMCDEPAPSFDEMKNALQDKERYCAPSWSWASRDKGVDFRWKTRPIFEVLRKKLQPAYSDAMVAVKHGSFIGLQGPIGPTPVKPSSGLFNKDSKRWANRWEVPNPPNGTLYFWLDWVPGNESPGSVDPQSNTELFVIAVEPTLDGKGNGSAYGLLLLEFEDGYRRVGMFQQHGNVEWFANFEVRYVEIK